MQTRKYFFLLLIFYSVQSFAQQTIGLFVNEPSAFEGYTLFAPLDSEETYLINNCGEKIHSWSSQYRPGASCYLMDDGTLVRAGRLPGTSEAPGIVEMIAWDGTVIWSYSAFEDYGRQHHDIEILPSGNILLLVWDIHQGNELDSIGAMTPLVSIKFEQIIEIQPNIVTGETTVVWEWRAWDHMIQDVSDSLANYGIVADHPERIDINYQLASTDFLHFNSIDYNDSLDQIIVSVHKYSEFWIIDHSTTTEEAAGSTGGTYGKGGDLLYRWGNPRAYDQGFISDQQINSQHHAHWIPPGYPDEGKIILFNNKANTFSGNSSSSINIIDPDILPDGSYNYQDGAFGPDSSYWFYEAPNPSDFYSYILSGVQRLENGNTLICEGIDGRFFEIDTQDNIVWEYVNPVNHTGPLEQGASLDNNDVFRCERYPLDFPGFDGKDLSPKGHLEIDTSFLCGDSVIMTDYEDIPKFQFSISPNPAKEITYLNVKENNFDYLNIEVVNINGERLLTKQIKNISAPIELDLHQLNAGIYFISLSNDQGRWIEKIILTN